MLPYPNRSDFNKEMAALWNARELEYYRQFPIHPRAADWLAANPTPGINPETVSGIDGVILVNWPIDTTPAPDIDGWLAEVEKARQQAEDEKEAQEKAANEAAQKAAQDKANQIAKYQAAIDHLEGQLESTADPTQQILLQTAIDGMKRMMA